MSNYAIGSADNFEVILAGGIERVEYDLKQAYEQGYARYQFLDEMYTTDELTLGTHIPVNIADDIIENGEWDVYGFAVPDHMVALFVHKYPEKKILRVRDKS